MSTDPAAKIETIHAFIDEIDARLGALSEEEIEALFREFADGIQPWLIGLFTAIEESHQIESEFLGECVFHFYTLQAFFEERLQLQPPAFGKNEVLAAIDAVDGFFAKPDADAWNHPVLQLEWPRLFFTVWEGCLDDLTEEGSVDESLRDDLVRFYLVVLTLFSDRFPAAAF
jgi:hypothetical protein